MTAAPARVLAIFGPTAAGKSALAHQVARTLDGEIVVADPFQRYRGLEIAADSPSARERREVPYHCVGDLDLTEATSAAGYAELAHSVIDAILERGRVPIVTGGTGLYLRAALTEMGFPPQATPRVREWAAELVSCDPAAAGRILERLDPGAARRVDTANPRRLERALQLAVMGAGEQQTRLWDGSMRLPTWLVAVTRPRPLLDERILLRVHRELSDGLVAELERALDTPGVRREPLQIIGAREVDEVRRGDLAPEELPERLAARTRQLSRRQLQWLRRWPDAEELDLGHGDPEDAVGWLVERWRSLAVGTLP